jgi:hypothetical protein
MNLCAEAAQGTPLDPTHRRSIQTVPIEEFFLGQLATSQAIAPF